MLQSIRDKTHGLIAGIIISLLILSFALWGIHSYIGGGSDNSTVAKVNGQIINKSQLSVAYERLRRQFQIQNNSNVLPLNAETTLKTQALQNLVTIQILKNDSLKQGYRISMNQVDNVVETMPEFQVNNRFSQQRFQQVLTSALYTPSDFLSLLQTSLLIDQPRLGILFSSFGLPNEVNDAITLVNQERDVAYAILLFSDFKNSLGTIPHEQIVNYYQTHPDEFKTPEQVSIDYIELTTNSLSQNQTASETELKSFYNENPNAFADPAKWQVSALLIPLSENASETEVNTAQQKMQDILAQLKSGHSFEELARQYPASSLRLPPWMTLNQAPQTLQPTLMSLTKPNQIAANPVRIKEGLVLLKLIEMKEPQIQPYEKVSEKVKEVFSHQKALEKFNDVKEKLANIAYEHPDSLQPAANELNLPIKTTSLFSKDKGNSDISSNPKIRAAAFSRDVLNSQNNSDIIQLSPEAVIVLRVKTHVPASIMPLVNVEPSIENQLQQSTLQSIVESKANKIAMDLNRGKPLDQVNTDDHLVWKNLGYIGRRATQIDAAILDQAFAMPRPRAAMLVIYSSVKTQNGYAIVALKGIKDGDLSKNEQQDIFTDQIQNAQGIFEYLLYKNSLIKAAKVELENASTDS